MGEFGTDSFLARAKKEDVPCRFLWRWAFILGVHLSRPLARWGAGHSCLTSVLFDCSKWPRCLLAVCGRIPLSQPKVPPGSSRFRRELSLQCWRYSIPFREASFAKIRTGITRASCSNRLPLLEQSRSSSASSHMPYTCLFFLCCAAHPPVSVEFRWSRSRRSSAVVHTSICSHEGREPVSQCRQLPSAMHLCPVHAPQHALLRRLLSVAVRPRICRFTCCTAVSQHGN